ncbi:tRNA (guanosine(37)-N1)-methyltransferase TrmD [Castellaniella sp. S9]|uniref:tRNA (guanosine(37)-N1)-methyltransferase TrmD n=1 Tax=Castellaniella sp. S9 TaxID=2993652 RepID=UPI0022B34819|nr:tRNA (guanosine(37)-N1)-methyltransferase TrmD [Castellaniella sp. S9]
MRFDLITLFPDMFAALRDQGVTGRAHARGLWSLGVWNPRDFTEDVHRTVDDRPYGGGPGMVMMAEPLARAVAAARAARHAESAEDPDRVPVVLLSPAGRRHDQRLAQRWARSSGAILICGRYEGVDQRFIDRHVTEELSLGDYVLSGGELAAMVVMDSVLRLLPGVLHDAQSAEQDSFNPALGGLLDSPHYTRPEVWDGVPVPEVLLSGHHAQIAEWRRRQSLALTLARRPDLLEAAPAKDEADGED